MLRITNILLSDKSEPFLSPINLEIFYETFSTLQLPVTFKIIYIGSIESSQYDQILLSLEKPITHIGEEKLSLMAVSPNPDLIPTLEDLLGMSALMVSCSYNNQEFFRCSYYVRNDYISEIDVNQIQQKNLICQNVFRCFFTAKPKIIINDIDWNDYSFYDKYIDVDLQHDIHNVKKETEFLLKDIDDPFSFNENSFFRNN
jgi:histone chaperone ASF1